MPSKRANTGGSKAASSPNKKHRSRAGAAPVDHLLAACSPMLDVLRTGEAIEKDDDGATAGLLCAALPFALKVTEGAEQRHAYQEKLLGVVSAQLASIVVSQRDTVVVLEKKKADLEAERAQGVAVREQIAVRLAEKVKDKDAASERSKGQQVAFNEAQAALASARHRAEAADLEKQALEKNRDNFAAGLADLFTPLKNSETVGKHWREREKMLARLSDKVKLAGAGSSLLAALLVALKLKSDARSEFAQATVAHGEDLYMKHIASLKENVEKFDEEISARAAAITEAEACARAAEEALDAATEADISAQNVWLEVTSEASNQEAKMEMFGPTVEHLEKELRQTRIQVSSLEEVFDSFEALRPVGAVLKVMGGPDKLEADVLVQATVADEQVVAP